MGECEWSEGIDLPKLEKVEKGRGCFENGRMIVESERGEGGVRGRCAVLGEEASEGGEEGREERGVFQGALEGGVVGCCDGGGNHVHCCGCCG